MEWQIAVPAMAAAGAPIGLLAFQQRGQHGRRVIVPAAVAVAVLSLSITVASSPIAGGAPRVAVAALVETAGLLALIVLSVRYRPGWQAFCAALLAGLAETALLFRASATPPEPIGFVLWGSGAGAAIAAGLYLRGLDARRTAAVASAQRLQRLGLARDLHDFVAHDVTAIVAGAQAAQLVLDQDREQARATLERIERTGLEALSSMDRMIEVLRQPQAGTGGPSWPDGSRDLGGIEDIEALAHRFASAGVPVSVEIGTPLPASLPREISGTAYRVVSEALGNVQRHAPQADCVKVLLTRDGGELVVDVTNSASPEPPPRRRRPPGAGLPGLSERVTTLGGRLTAGPEADGGWRLTVRLPTSAGRP